MKAKLQFIAAAAAAVLASCAQEPAEQPGDASVSEDGGVESPDAGPQAARYLLPKKGLFGDTPVNNRFLNPDFDLAAEGWQPYPTQFGATALPLVQRLFVTESPTRQPILLMPKAPKNNFGVGIVGIARAGAGAFDVSVWVGRAPERVEEVTDVSVVGVHPDEGEQAWDLTPEPDTKVELGGRVWIRYAVRLDVGPVGFANLVVVDETDAPIFLTGPVMVPAPLESRGPPRVSLPGRPLKAREQAGLDAVARSQLQLTDPTRARAPRLPRPAPRR
jgi:hypothetical protein